MTKHTPFFAKYLENQLTTPAQITGGRPSCTLKWPSDNDEAGDDLHRRLRQRTRAVGMGG